MAHLKKSASGHLRKTGSGNLVYGCDGCCGEPCSWGAPGDDCSEFVSGEPGCASDSIGIPPEKLLVTMSGMTDSRICPACENCNIAIGALCFLGVGMSALNGSWELTQDPMTPCQYRYDAEPGGPITIRGWPGRSHPDCSTDTDFVTFNNIHFLLDFNSGFGGIGSGVFFKIWTHVPGYGLAGDNDELWWTFMTSRCGSYNGDCSFTGATTRFGGNGICGGSDGTVHIQGEVGI